MSFDVYEEYIEHDKHLTPLKDKRPIIEDWLGRLVPGNILKEFCEKGFNLGWVIGEGDLVVDVDVKNGSKGLESFKKLQKIVGPIDKTVMTPSGGFHCYLTYDFEKYGELRGKLRQYPGIDFLSKGKMCVAASSKVDGKTYDWVDQDFGCFEQDPASDDLLRLLSRGTVATVVEDDEDDNPFDPNHGVYEEKTEAEIDDLLDELDPDDGYHEWLEIGMALHSWDKLRGLPLWINWSRSSKDFSKDECKAKWSGFGRNASGNVTIGTLIYRANESRKAKARQELRGVVDELKDLDRDEIVTEWADRVKQLGFSGFDLEEAASAMKVRLKQLTGTNLPISQARRMLRAPIEQRQVDAPEWCENWLHCSLHSTFINRQTRTIYTPTSFNIECGIEVPMGPDGGKPSATKYVSDNGFVRTVAKAVYLPGIDDDIVEVNGQSVFNTFNPETVTDEEEVTEEGQKLIDRLVAHIKLICGDDETAEWLIEWMCHQVQHPGKQVLWSPVIQGPQGVGKSLLGGIMSKVLGDDNVGTVSPTQVSSVFNGWATGVCVNVLEELRVVGHNRHEAINAVKPLITDAKIQINEKGVKPYVAMNTTNYICFTNFKDAIPLDGTDRRWFVIFCAFVSLKDFLKEVGVDTAAEYFQPLFDGVRDRAGEVRQWMLDYKISDRFYNQKVAPETAAKLSMIATEESNMEGLTETRELIEEGCEMVTSVALSSSHLFDELLDRHEDLVLSARSKNAILKRLGYTQLEVPVKIDGKAHRIWITGPRLNNAEIRNLLAT